MAHMLLCMVAYYLDWHLAEWLAPVLFAEEGSGNTKAEADPVGPAPKPRGVAQGPHAGGCWTGSCPRRACRIRWQAVRL